MAIVFTPSKKTSDGRQTYFPHDGNVSQTKKLTNGREVVVPGKVGSDGLIVPPVKKDFWLRDFLQRRERGV